MKLLTLLVLLTSGLSAQILNPGSGGSGGIIKASFAPPCTSSNSGKGYYIPGTPTVEYCVDITGHGDYQYFILSGSQQFASNMQTWSTALSNSSTTSTHMAIVGDSLSACYGVVNPLNCWPRRLAISLQTHYGNNGSGILPALQGTLPGGNTNGSSYWNIVGPVAFPTGGNYGPYQNSGTGVPNGGPFSSILNLSSGSATSISSWLATSVNVYTQTGPETNAATVYANGVNLGTCGGSTVSYQDTVCTFNVTSGLTQLKIVGPNTGNFYFYAGQFVNGTKGISVDNIGHTGAESAAFSSDISHQLAELDYVQSNSGVSLVVIELGANEYLDSTTITTLNTNLASILAHVQAYSPKPSVVVWDFNYFMGSGQADTINGAGFTQTDYHNALHTFATTNGLPIVSMFDYWGKTGGTGLTYTDLAHPNDAGNNIEAQRAQLVIDPNGPAITSGGQLSATVLDGNPQVAVAYSIRRLYMGSIKSMQVTSSAAGNPTQDIGFTSNGDLDTATLASFCGVNTCTVSEWYDQSGNGRDASQTTLANQPVIFTSGAIVSATGSSLPTLNFNSGSASLVSTFSVTGTQVESAIVATYLPTAGSYANLASLFDAGDVCNVADGACMIVRANTDNFSVLVAVGSTSFSAEPYTPGNLFWQDSILNGTSGSSVTDQNAVSTASGFTANLNVTHLQIGSMGTQVSEYVQYVGINASSAQTYLHASEKTYFGLP